MDAYSIFSDEVKKITIQSYNNHIKEYIEKVNNDDSRLVAYWPGVEFFLSKLAKNANIFEVGSGSGSDARRIEREGFIVFRSDVTEAFVKFMRASGYDAKYYDVLEGPLFEKHLAIFANAVFLYFTLEQFRCAINNVSMSLTNGGLFCIDMKLGDFEGWREKGLSGKRYFKFWKLKDLQVEITKAGFVIMNSYITPGRDFAVITSRWLF